MVNNHLIEIWFVEKLRYGKDEWYTSLVGGVGHGIDFPGLRNCILISIDLIVVLMYVCTQNICNDSDVVACRYRLDIH